MANKLNISDVRKSVSKDDGGNIGNGNLSRGETRRNLSLRNEVEVPDEVLRNEINRSSREVADELGFARLPDNENAIKAARYFTFLRVSLYIEGREKPHSVSHARRYGYENQQRKFWRDRMIRALQDF